MTSEQLLGLALIALVGCAAQFVDGTLGMGFGVFSASVLLALGMPPSVVVATVNVVKLSAGVASGASHWRAGNVRRDWLLPLIVPGMIGGAVGAHVLGLLPQTSLRVWMSVVLIGMGVLMLCRSLWPSLFNRATAASDKPALSRSSRLEIAGVGAVAGFLNALSGAYGPFATSAVMLTRRARPFFAVGTVSVAEVFVAGAVISTLISERGFGIVPWSTVVALSVGAVLSAPFAARACRRLPRRVLVLGTGLALIGLNVGVAVFVR
jgi:uncharacterized membrane protein YfcA